MKGQWLLKDLHKVKKSTPTKHSVDTLDIERHERNMQLIDRCRNRYESLRPFRVERKRCYEFLRGNQWGDLVIDPDDPCGERLISEEDLLRREGRVPLSNNLILKVVNIMLGIFRSNKREPIAVARDNSEALIGDMMSNAMQYVYHANEAQELNTDGLKELLLSGMAISSVKYEWVMEQNDNDVVLQNELPCDVFFDGDLSDVRLRNLNMIGFLRSYTRSELLSRFAKSKEEREWLNSLYDRTAFDTNNDLRNPFSKDRHENEDFYTPYEKDKLRVIEVWTLEEKERLRCHDTEVGEMYVAELDAKEYIDNINTYRAEAEIEYSGEADNANLIEYEYFVDRFWTLRYLTPYGDEIMAMETPYDHLSHPYTIRVYRMLNGKPQSFVSNLIPQQKYINRYITMMDFMRGASAKGVLIFPENLRPKNMTHEQIARTWTKSNGVIFTQMKPGDMMPQQFNSPSVNGGDVQMLEMQEKLLEEISGVHAALAGQTASQGTPSSLYAQESQNASTNLQDVMDFFLSFVRARDIKMLKVIQQYFTHNRYLNIAGADFSEAAKNYDPSKVRNVLFDMSLAESTTTPAYRMSAIDNLKELAIAKVIPWQLFMKYAKLPYYDNVLREMEQMGQAADPNAMAQSGEMPTDGMQIPNDEQIVANDDVTKTPQQQINAAMQKANAMQAGVPA